MIITPQTFKAQVKSLELIFVAGQKQNFNIFSVNPSQPIPVWLGWACLTKKVHGPWHQGVCFDLPMIFCA
jgi:hypothetical protein